MNWGEPWYAGFRESQTEYRLKNQDYFKRNLMPAMLGWFNMTPETSVEDIEWMLARSAAFNAGYAFCTRYETLEQNGRSDEILRLLGEWEKARISGAFTDEQKRRMENIENEFHLETVSESEWDFYQIYSFKFRHANRARQPGEPSSSTWRFENPAESQTMRFILTADNGSLEAIKFEIDGIGEMGLPASLKSGEILKYTGGDHAVLYTKNGLRLKAIPMDASVWFLAKGKHAVSFDCRFSEGEEPAAKLEIRLAGSAERIRAR
jgi:hypothetical protein